MMKTELEKSHRWVKIETMLSHIKEAFRRYFLTGLLILVPISITIWIIRFLLGFLGKVLNLAILPTSLDLNIPGGLKSLILFIFRAGNFAIGLTLALAGILFVGMMARNFLGRRLISFGENLIDRIPLVRTIYSAIKQLMEGMFRGTKDFSRVVLVEYPRKGIYSLAFVTGGAMAEFKKKAGENLISIFIPSTPNPTTGFYLVIPEEDLIPLDLTPEDAFRVLISAGMATSAKPPGDTSE